MTAFAFLNWFCCLLTSLLLGLVVWRQRFLLVKPSMIVITFFHLMVQWAATVNSPYIETYLPNPWVFALLSQGFPLIGLLVSLWTWRRSAFVIWRRLHQPRPVSMRVRRKAIAFLAAYLVLFVPFYLSYVPPTKTGLYAVFADPLNSALARESSLKLVASPLIAYGYAFMASVFGPLLAVLLADSFYRNLKRRRWLRSLATAVGVGGVVVAVSLTGARSYAAAIIMTILLAAWLRRGLPLNPVYVVLAALSVLTLPTLLSILREGNVVEWARFWAYLRGAIFWRVFYLPMKTGLMHVHYAQTVGLFGVRAIPRLAALLGIPPVNAPNVIALTYSSTALATSIANTAYVYAYYSYFGLPSFAISLLGLWGLDIALWAYRHISDRLLLACVASVSVASIMFVNMEYTIVLLSNGFATLLVVAWIIDRLCRIRIRLGAPGLLGGGSPAGTGKSWGSTIGRSG